MAAKVQILSQSLIFPLDLKFSPFYRYIQHKIKIKQVFFGSCNFMTVLAESMTSPLFQNQQTFKWQYKSECYKNQNHIDLANFKPLMDTLNLYSDEEYEDQKFAYNSPESLSPTPSPQPSNNYLQFSRNNTVSTQSEMINPYSPVSKSSRRGRRLSEECKNVNRGHWSTQENKKYHWFLEIHYSHFVNRHMRRMDKIFKTMELFVGTRQAEQCRSHHQKMEKKYLNFATIITNLRKLHYDSQLVQPIIEDMEALGVKAFDGLATIQYLKEQQSIDPALWELKDRKRSTSTRGRVEKSQVKEVKEVKEEVILDNAAVEGSKWDDVEYNPMNMLEESIMNIGDLGLYHEKDENSSFFNSIFL